MVSTMIDGPGTGAGEPSGWIALSALAHAVDCTGNTIVEPSGDHFGCHPANGLLASVNVSCRRSDPSDRMMKICERTKTSVATGLEKAIHAPSGDHAGSASSGFVLRTRRSPPSASMVAMPPPSRTNATRMPSADQLGLLAGM